MEQVDLLLVSTAFVQLEAMAKTNQGNSLIASEYYWILGSKRSQNLAFTYKASPKFRAKQWTEQHKLYSQYNSL